MKKLVGQSFGKLVVQERLGKNKYNIYLWDCKCSCGNSKIVPTNFLTSGSTKSCGCLQYKTGVRKDLTGNKYSKLTVLNYSHTAPSNSMSYYKCLCECGTEKVVAHGSLQSGKTRSCGCNQNKTGKDSVNYKHGMSKTKVYSVWSKMTDRCFNTNNPDYKDYGAKGITVSDEFKNDFIKFYSEIGDPPSKQHSVDRINHTRGYETGNVRWATNFQQARNKGKPSNNTSGETGVVFYHSGEPNHSTYVVSTWYCLETQKQKNKKFSVKKLGLLPAFKQAVEYRRKMIDELNAQGAGYADNHGK